MPRRVTKNSKKGGEPDKMDINTKCSLRNNNGDNLATTPMQIDKECKCEKLFDFIKQENYGICWFVSVLNMFTYSDGLKKFTNNYIETIKPFLKPKTIAESLNTNISGQYCTNVEEYIKDIIKSESNAGSSYLNNILKEFISYSDDKLRFDKQNSKSGGYPYLIIYPLLVKMGANPLHLKHVIYNLDDVGLLLPTNVHPRSLKLNRMCQDYLQDYERKKRDIQIFIITTGQNTDDGMIKSITENNNLFMGKYICFIEGNELIVYKLDCMSLSSNNNTVRGSAHIICAVTCNDQGYILNSYNAIDQGIKPFKNCSIYEYDWYKWKLNEFYQHSITVSNNHACKDGTIINYKFKNTHIPLFTQSDYYLYHKNVGLNTHVYIKEANIQFITNHLFETLHEVQYTNFNNLYNTYLKPYLYLLYNKLKREINNIFIDSINPLTNKNVYLNPNLVQPGLLNHNTNNTNIVCYKILHNDILDENEIKVVKDTLPDELTIYIENSAAYTIIIIFIQYQRSYTSPSYSPYGGKKAKGKSKKKT